MRWSRRKGPIPEHGKGSGSREMPSASHKGSVETVVIVNVVVVFSKGAHPPTQPFTHSTAVTVQVSPEDFVHELVPQVSKTLPKVHEVVPQAAMQADLLSKKPMRLALQACKQLPV